MFTSPWPFTCMPLAAVCRGFNMDVRRHWDYGKQHFSVAVFLPNHFNPHWHTHTREFRVSQSSISAVYFTYSLRGADKQNTCMYMDAALPLRSLILNVSAAEVTAALFELFIYLITPRRHHKAPILSAAPAVSARRHKKYVNRSYKVNLTASNQEETELRFDF